MGGRAKIDLFRPTATPLTPAGQSWEHAREHLDQVRAWMTQGQAETARVCIGNVRQYLDQLEGRLS